MNSIWDATNQKPYEPWHETVRYCSGLNQTLQQSVCCCVFCFLWSLLTRMTQCWRVCKLVAPAWPSHLWPLMQAGSHMRQASLRHGETEVPKQFYATENQRYPNNTTPTSTRDFCVFSAGSDLGVCTSRGVVFVGCWAKKWGLIWM